VIGERLGQRRALGYSQLDRTVSETTAMIARQSAGSQAVLVVAVLLSATGTGLAVQGLAGVTRQLWLGRLAPTADTAATLARLPPASPRW
jgi:hypothetical protein